MGSIVEPTNFSRVQAPTNIKGRERREEGRGKRREAVVAAANEAGCSSSNSSMGMVILPLSFLLFLFSKILQWPLSLYIYIYWCMQLFSLFLQFLSYTANILGNLSWYESIPISLKSIGSFMAKSWYATADLVHMGRYLIHVIYSFCVCS